MVDFDRSLLERMAYVAGGTELRRNVSQIAASDCFGVNQDCAAWVRLGLLLVGALRWLRRA